MKLKHWKLFTTLCAALLVVILAVPMALADGRPGGQRGQQGGGWQFAVAAEVIGITPEELRNELREAEVSIADVANAHGVDPNSIVDAILEKAAEHLAEKVAAGELTQAQADEILAHIKETASERIYLAPGKGQHPQRPRG